ncbi:PH domain-containing protein [Cellulophaga sp. 20_2_10]|uniref:PH domain-containing protein n=1 Tax=Cellulophaga sp. 20_2_10 TaxID=2942476 RepID=UPI00201AEF1F|nr:PH domain-containing protein [Cellulophaga sp. 20_2_10]MCL5245276.1 PH domain-containing protein [Cellulophaga sp. 20_2_10]
MLFKSRKDTLFRSIVFTIAVLLCFILYISILGNTAITESIVSVVVTSLVLCFLLWVFYGTSYKLTSTTLRYKSGPIKGNIPIAEIHQIIKGKTLWVGLKPATASKGLIVKYNKFSELYISPETNDSFIAEILKHNSSIEIITV